MLFPTFYILGKAEMLCKIYLAFSMNFVYQCTGCVELVGSLSYGELPDVDVII